MESTDIAEYMQEFKGKFPTFRDCKDFELLSLMCIYYFFYGTTDASFDQDENLSYLVDGANDGGIDAVFKDPNSETDDIVIVQSKFYGKTKLSKQDIASEIAKIKETIGKLDSGKCEEFSQTMVSAFKNAVYEKSSRSEFNICFFTTYNPKSSREIKSLKDAAVKAGQPHNVDVYFVKDIEEQIRMCESGKVCVESAKLDLDQANNFLQYVNPETQNESIIVNISAKSLKNLFQRKGNALLGLNLRYYTKQKEVDNGIKKTITEHPNDFWYKNNGIVIICEKYELDSKVLKLTNFSIVNGGQTTNRIGHNDFEKDFYITCKVIQSEGSTEGDKDAFALEIAESTNAQKPIRKADLVANTPEQIRLKARLKKCGVFYTLKKGDKPEKNKYESYEITKVDEVGKLSLAAVLQMPGSARSSSTKMYNDENRYTIWGDKAEAEVIKDLLKISFYYEKYKKSDLASTGADEGTITAIKNGKTFQIACIVLLCKIVYGVFPYEDVSKQFYNTDELKRVLKKTEPMKKIISAKLDDEKETFEKIFRIIGEEVLAYCINDSVKGKNSPGDASNYLKSDENYYKECIKRLWSRFNQNKELKNYIYMICNKKLQN